MKILKLSILLATTCCIHLAAANEKSIDLGGTTDPFTGEELTYRISSEIVDTLPQWNGLSSVPLELNTAIAAARSQAEKDHPDQIGPLHAVFFGLRGIEEDGIWAYAIAFKILNTPTTEIIGCLVLLDRSVISGSQIQTEQGAAANP